ncbi:MAG: HAMP domain-containing protein [Elusimicrobiaceae bacterium]|nr:HAMP domain-containing protein [Elusimicrobiaceae bacterium]
MKLTSKWILCFVLVSVYAAMMGGLFYYNLFKFVFDKKLQNEMVEMVRYRAPSLVQWLASRPKGEATFREAEVMKDLARTDERIKSLVYLNYDGSIRWHENTQFLRMSYPDYNNAVGFDTNAAMQAIRDRLPRAILFGKGNYYDMAIPLLAKDSVVAGVINVIVSRESAKKLIHSSMIRYAFGALVMILLIGGVLYLFLLLKIIRPLGALKDSIDAISLNNLTLAFPKRQDEIGDVSQAVESLLDKIRTDMKRLESAETVSLGKEQTWWRSLLEVLVPQGARGMIIDENNNILYANFELETATDKAVHLLDVFDGRQQGVIQVVGEALEQPGKVLRGSVVDKDVKYVVKAAQLPGEGGKNRVALVLEPEK